MMISFQTKVDMFDVTRWHLCMLLSFQNVRVRPFHRTYSKIYYSLILMWKEFNLMWKNLDFHYSCPELWCHVTWHSKNLIKRYKFLSISITLLTLNGTMYSIANKAFSFQSLCVRDFLMCATLYFHCKSIFIYYYAKDLWTHHKTSQALTP